MTPFLNSLIGTPYDAEHDCYWLVRTVLAHELGVFLPEKSVGWRRYGKILSHATEPEKYDVLFFSGNALGLVDHIGVMIDVGNFMHADKRCGQTVCEELAKHKFQVKAIGRPNK